MCVDAWHRVITVLFGLGDQHSWSLNTCCPGDVLLYLMMPLPCCYRIKFALEPKRERRCPELFGACRVRNQVVDSDLKLLCQSNSGDAELSILPTRWILLRISGWQETSSNTSCSADHCLLQRSFWQESVQRHVPFASLRHSHLELSLA